MNFLLMSRGRRRLLRGTVVMVLVMGLVLLVRGTIWLLNK